MLNINHILFPTDFSENSENALKFAQKVAARTSARLTLFHVIEAPAYVSHNVDDLPKTHSAKVRTLLDQQVEAIHSTNHNSDISVNSVIQNGNVVSSILEYVSQKKSDINLIIMGTKGKSKMEQILYGSVASRILLESPVPVLTVPPNSSTSFDLITFTTDYRPNDWQAFEHTMDWADTFGSTLRVLHIAEQRDFTTDIQFRGFKDLVEEKTQDHTIEFDLVIQKQFLTGVADYLAEYPVGLFVLVRYKKDMLEKLLSPNHTKQLSYHAKVPMLVLVGDQE